MAGLYLHIPFCKQACHYCNFHFATSLHHKPALLKAMQAELAGQKNDWSTHRFDTIYFGGGTPSLLTETELATLLDSIHMHYTVCANAEITLEANPDDIQSTILKDWRTRGINRLSLGIQSFFEHDLQWMNRAHSATQARQALKTALEYFPNLTADLIYGTPGLTDAQWTNNIQTLIDLNVPHISAYALTVEPKTPLEKQIRLQQKTAVDNDQQARQFLLLMDQLRQAGYEHYEISNFAKPGYRSQHNSSYWKGTPYLGIGPSAHSYLPPIRSWQISNNPQYIERIKKGDWFYEQETLSPAQQLNETILISLRTIEGLDLTSIPTNIQENWNTLLDQYRELGWINIESSRLRLTDEGKLQADGISAALFVDESDQIN